MWLPLLFQCSALSLEQGTLGKAALLDDRLGIWARDAGSAAATDFGHLSVMRPLAL